MPTSAGKWIYISSVLCCFLLSSPIIAEEKEPNWAKLFANDVIVEEVKTSDNLPGVKASFCIKSTPDKIWSVLTGYDDFPQIYKGLKRINVRKSSNNGLEVEYSYLVTFLGIFNKELNYVLSDQYSPSHRQIVWKRVSGDLERIEGSWEIIDTRRDGTYLLVYRAYIKPPWYVPRYLLRSRVMNATREMADAVRMWIERSGQENHAGLSMINDPTSMP